MNRTKISYLDYTWNVTVGCSSKPISKGCANCYAKTMAHRLKAMGSKDYQIDDPFKPRFLSHRLNEPIKEEKPSRLGVSFMGDLFHDDISFDSIRKVLAQPITESGSKHTYLLLTKRPKRMERFYNKYPWYAEHTENIWFGVSVEDQKTADERIPILLQIPAAVRWVSYEPALERVDFSKYLDPFRKLDLVYKTNIQNGMINEDQADSLKEPILDWIVVGAETGQKARPFNILWGRHTRNQCWAAGVPFFFKSAGKQKTPDDLQIREYPNAL